jgi:hypothetical protein
VQSIKAIKSGRNNFATTSVIWNKKLALQWLGASPFKTKLYWIKNVFTTVKSPQMTSFAHIYFCVNIYKE